MKARYTKLQKSILVSAYSVYKQRPELYMIPMTFNFWWTSEGVLERTLSIMVERGLLTSHRPGFYQLSESAVEDANRFYEAQERALEAIRVEELRLHEEYEREGKQWELI